MNMQEMSRFILGLRTVGWSGDEINDFVLYIETGEEHYLKKIEKSEKNDKEHQ